MKPTGTTEKALERLIVRHLAGVSEHPAVTGNTTQQPVSVYAPGGYVLGRASD
jgi:type I restriction enzyme R subunit